MLRDKLKDAKRMLLSNMDPFIVETLKEIVKKDLKKEIQEMRQSDSGCSDKCRLINEVQKYELERNEAIVKVILSFKWCDNCSNPQRGAVHICSSGCGQKLVSKCIPLMKEFGEKEKDI